MRVRNGSIARFLAMLVVVVLLTLGSSALTVLGGEPGVQGLFAASGVRGSIDRAGEPTVLRSRYVDLNLGLLLREDGVPRDLPGNPLTLNFFEDTALVVVLNRVEASYGGGFVWTGQVQDEPLSPVTLAVNDGVMAGMVSLRGRVFEVSYAGGGAHAVYEIDQSGFPPEAEPIPAPIPEGEQDAVPSAVADDGSIIDVMVVYTPAARSAVGGTTPMLTLITLAVSETNQTYSNSGIAQRLRLVYTTEVYYVETTFRAALDDLTNPDDGQMDVVHALRNTYGADEVVLIIDDNEYCGMAWLMQNVSLAFESNAFAVVYWRCPTEPYYSFGHELGHNMGAQHDYYAVTKYNQPSGAYWYSYGYVNTTIRRRTMMAYNDACSDLGFNCERIPYWSNPNVTYNGVPIGTASADNHRTLNNTASTVANFRQSVVDNPPDAPSNLKATPVPPWQINLSWTDNSNDEDGFRIERSQDLITWSTLGTVGANTTTYSDTSVTPETTYYYRVIAYNAYGYSDPSNTASAELEAQVGPLAYDGYVIDDDNWWGTSGNDNGLAECGETVGLTVMLKNEGNTAAEDISSELTILDTTYLYDIGTTESDYPDIPGGASAGNVDAFEFSVDEENEDTPFAHWIDSELAVTASNWGGGTIEFSLPIVCPTKAEQWVYLPLIFKDGS